MNAATQIANHLKIEVTKIKRCEEWAKVWFAVIQGKGARFVSKKVVKMINQLIEVVCSRSGLKFEAENRRKKVHPEIAYYTTHKNYDIRYTAIAVIEKGKAEGWGTIEKFEEEIQKALNPEPPTRPDYDFEGAWAAVIEGSNEKYRFNRVFLKAVDTEGRFKRYAFADNGIYECCYKSGKGNETRYYYRVENGTKQRIELEEVESLFPVIQSNLVSNDPLTSAARQIVEECWECGATYTSYGNVEYGNMSCRRCA